MTTPSRCSVRARRKSTADATILRPISQRTRAIILTMRGTRGRPRKANTSCPLSYHIDSIALILSYCPYLINSHQVGAHCRQHARRRSGTERVWIFFLAQIVLSLFSFGIGVLGLPYAARSMGWVLAAIVLPLVTMFSMCVSWMANRLVVLTCLCPSATVACCSARCEAVTAPYRPVRSMIQL